MLKVAVRSPGGRVTNISNHNWNCFYRQYSSNLDSIETVQLAYDKHVPKDGISKGDPLIFLHGLFGSKTNNRSVSKVLARDLQRTVYCLDLRNHGHSPHIKRHDYPSMAADVKRFLSAHEIRSSVLIGHSMGAKVAMAIALECPSNVSALISVDNAPVDASLGGSFPVYVKAMMEIERAKPTKQAEMFEILDKYEKKLPVQQFLLSNFKRNPHSHAYHSRIPLEILGHSIATGYMGAFPYLPSDHQYTGPTLFIRGTDSTYVPDDVLPLIGQYFPRFIVRDIKSGHWVISEKPLEFIREAKEFLTSDDEGM